MELGYRTVVLLVEIAGVRMLELVVGRSSWDAVMRMGDSKKRLGTMRSASGARDVLLGNMTELVQGLEGRSDDMCSRS